MNRFSFQPAILVAGVAIAVLGGYIALGWCVGNLDLPRLHSSMAPMKADTAFCFALAGMALCCCSNEADRRAMRIIGRGMAGIVAVIGAVRLIEYAAEAPDTVSHLLDQPLADAIDRPFRMPPPSALTFLLIGLAILSMDWRGWAARLSQIFTLSAASIALLALVGWIYRAFSFRVPTTSGGLAWHSVLAFLVLCAGLFHCRPSQGFMTLLSSPSAGGALARRLLPAAVIMPILVGWGVLEIFFVERRPQITMAFAYAAIANVLVFTILIWLNLAWLHRVDIERQQAAEAAQQANVHLATLNESLAQKNQESEMFVYSVSHDLRSPLVNLHGFSKELATVFDDLRNLLNEDDIPDAVRQRALEILERDAQESLRFIQTGVVRLSSIIDALLRLSRAGRVEYQWQKVDLNPIVKRIVDAMMLTITERGARVSVAELPIVWGDPTALEQVFANLIGNALNYLDPKRPGVIEVRHESQGDEAVIIVKDNGLGIPKEAQAKMFQIFQRHHPTAAKGEGIGLAIVRRVVERHRGKIELDSTPSVGSAFAVRLPTEQNENRLHVI